MVAALMPPNLLRRRRDVFPAREALLNRFLFDDLFTASGLGVYRCCSPGARSGLLQACASLFCFLTPEVVGSKSGAEVRVRRDFLMVGFCGVAIPVLNSGTVLR